jgi:hypothetical protein
MNKPAPAEITSAREKNRPGRRSGQPSTGTNAAACPAVDQIETE